MATLALPRPREWDSPSVLGAVLLLGVLGLLSGFFGTAWDVSWHRTIGRDSFWIAPHLFTYAGVMLGGVAALVATGTAMAGRRIHGSELRVGPLRAELGIAMVGVGSALIILTAPFDDAWHRTFGPDIDIWSPPHLAAIGSASLVYLGWTIALVPGAFPVGDTLRRILRVGMFGALTGTAVFAMNFYYFMAVTRDAVYYPLLVAAAVPLIFALGDGVIGEKNAPTKIALWYTTVSLIALGIFALTQWRAPAFPPLVLAGAFAIDLVRRRTTSPLAIGVAFAVAFAAAEWVRMVLFPAPAPASAVASPGADRGTLLFLQYYGQAVARPWTSVWPLAGALGAAAAATLSWIAGARIGRALRLPAERPSAA